MAAVVPIAQYVRLHGLTADDLVPLARKLVSRLSASPPAPFADAFNRLQHNETFGTGGSQSVGGTTRFAAELRKREGAELHCFASEQLAAVRWPEAKIFASETIAWWERAPVQQRLALPSAFLSLAAPAIQKINGSRLSIYAPAPIAASGGHRTIYNVARHLSRIGLNVEIFLEGVGAGIECVEDYLAGTPAIIHTRWHRHISAEVVFATIAHSSQFINEVDANLKAYLVQDFEASFNPMSDAYLLNENSYNQGNHHFTVGNWLAHLIRYNHGAAATPAGLGTDVSVYKPIKGIEREQAVCFLFQPDKPRRAPLIGISALQILKQKMPDAKIYVYGSDHPLNVSFP